MYRFLFNKIIREKFLDRLVLAKGHYTSKKLTPDEMLYELKLKLKEEAEEAFETKTSFELLEELADLLEVIEGLLTVSCLTRSDLSNARETKEIARGRLKLDEKILIVNIPDCEIFQDVICALKKKPERYPEV